MCVYEQGLALVVDENQHDRDERLPVVEFAYRNSVSAAIGLALNQAHIGRLPRLLLTILERPHDDGRHCLVRYQLVRCDIATDCQQWPCTLVREQHSLTQSHASRGVGTQHCLKLYTRPPASPSATGFGYSISDQVV